MKNRNINNVSSVAVSPLWIFKGTLMCRHHLAYKPVFGVCLGFAFLSDTVRCILNIALSLQLLSGQIVHQQ